MATLDERFAAAGPFQVGAGGQGDNKEGNVDSNVGESTTAEGFENEFLEGTPAIRTPSYPDLARKAFGKRGQTLVEIGIAASECLQCMLCNTDVIEKTKSYQ